MVKHIAARYKVGRGVDLSVQFEFTPGNFAFEQLMCVIAALPYTRLAHIRLPKLSKLLRQAVPLSADGTCNQISICFVISVHDTADCGYGKLSC